VIDAPDFYGLPAGEQFKALRSFPEFSGLPLKEQGTFLAKSVQQFRGTDKTGDKPKDAGFFSTLGHDIASIPGALAATGTGEPGDTRKPGILPAIGAAQHAEFEKGRTAPTVLERAGHTLAGAIPVIGPMAAGIGEEIAGGQYGQAGAHAVELAAPGVLKDVPVGKIGRALKATVGKGAAEGVSNGANAAAKIAGKLPEIHPVAKFLAKRIPGVGTTLDLLEVLKKQYGPALDGVPKTGRDELAYQLFEEKHGSVPKSALDRVTAIKEMKTELAGTKAAKPESVTPIRRGIEQDLYKEKHGKFPETAQERVRAIREYNRAVRSKAAKGAGAAGAAGAGTPEATPPVETAPKTTEEKIAAGRSSTKPTVQVRAGTGTPPAPRAEQVPEPSRDEEALGRAHQGFAADVNARMGGKLLAKGLTPDQVMQMSEDEFYKAVGPDRKFRGKLDPATGKPTSTHRTFEQGRNDVAAWMKLQAGKRGSFSFAPSSYATRTKIDAARANARKLNTLFESSDRGIERPPLPGEAGTPGAPVPKVPGKLIGRTTGRELGVDKTPYKAGFGIYEVPIDRVIGTEDISGSPDKLRDAAEYMEKIKVGSQVPPLWGHVDESGNVSIQGARRLLAAKRAGLKTVPVAIGQDYQASAGLVP
jgi:hypothetical protein